MHVCSIRDYLWTCMAVKTWTSDRCCVQLWVNVLWQGQVYRYVWSLRKLTVGQEAIVRSGHGTTDWFKIGKVVIKTIYCHPANLTYMQIGDGSLVAKSCLTDSYKLMDCSPPGSSVHGVFLARILEWVAISLPHLPVPWIEPRSPALWTDFLLLDPLEKRYMMQNARLDESSLESSFLGEISTISDMQMIPL